MMGTTLAKMGKYHGDYLHLKQKENHDFRNTIGTDYLSCGSEQANQIAGFLCYATVMDYKYRTNE